MGHCPTCTCPPLVLGHLHVCPRCGSQWAHDYDYGAATCEAGESLRCQFGLCAHASPEALRARDQEEGR